MRVRESFFGLGAQRQNKGWHMAKTKVNYIACQKQKAQSYINGVLDGSIVANKWVKLAVKRYKSDLKRKDLIKDQQMVDRVYKFFSLLSVKKGSAYRQFEFEPYQAFIVQNLFLFYWKKSRLRRFNYFFLFIARKNGKTVFATALNIYFLVADKEIDPQCLLLASTREQAAIALQYAKNIVKNSKALVKHVKRHRYELRYDKGTSTGIMKTLASKADTIDGYNPHSAILDEVHAYPDDSLFNVIKSGIMERENPLISLITTAGFTLDSLANDLVENSKTILRGEFTDDSFFCLLYTLDDNDDWHNPKCWIKSNPALGSLFSIDKLMIEYNQTKIRPSSKANFKTKNLNLFVETSEAWIDETQLNQVYNNPLPDLKGCKCYVGIDLSSTRDLASLVLLFEIDEVPRFKALTFFFLPNNPDKRLRKGGIDLAPWIEAGYIIEMQTKTLDYDFLIQFIRNLASVYEIVSMSYDPFNSALLVPNIEEMGIDCKPFKQTAMQFNFPLKFLEKQIYDNNIALGQNPVLRWNFRNVVLYIDGNGIIKIVKNKSLDSVDGVVSLAMAMGGWIAENLDTEGLNLDAYLKN